MNQELLLVVPFATALVGGIAGWMIGAARMRRRLGPRIRDAEAAAIAAESRVRELRKTLRPIRRQIADDVQERLQNTLYQFFTDLRTSLDLASDFADLREALTANREILVGDVDALKQTIESRLSTLRQALYEFADKQARTAWPGAEAFETLVQQVEQMTKSAREDRRDVLVRKLDEVMRSITAVRQAVDAFHWDMRTGVGEFPGIVGAAGGETNG